MSNINIKYGLPRNQDSSYEDKLKLIKGIIVSPGELISEGAGYMRGHGTYMSQNDTLYSSVLGEVNTVNKLLQAQHNSSKYFGNVGDLIIGRVTEVGIKRWRLHTNTKRDSYLLLSSMNLPGGELRRRSLEDEIHMRDVLQEGDLITAEVQIVHKDGSLSLQTRNLNYGKLDDEGLFISVPPYLIKRSRNHFLKLPIGLNLCLGNNGFIWISISPEGKINNKDNGNECEEDGSTDKNVIDVEMFERMVRLRNVIIAMSNHNIMLYEESIAVCYETSQFYKSKTLIDPEISIKFISAARRKTQL
ncbi:unnamed protein product [Gordionus sp. m RMFG-2023]|uniref:exosome complex component RRP4-like isoform X1 n=1 Tax=Gordionus sp. m RMFG-2023 TaxID=3053472 RepID=UPI0030E1BD91